MVYSEILILFHFSHVLIHFENSCTYCSFLHFSLHEKYVLKSKKSIKIVLVLFYHIHLVVTNMSVKCARYLEKDFMLCLLRVPLYLWDTTSLSVRLILSHIHELLFSIYVCFVCIVLSCRHLIWLCPLLTICDLFSHWSFHAYLWHFDFWLVSFVVLAAWIWVSYSCYLLLLRIFIRMVPFLILFTFFSILLLT